MKDKSNVKNLRVNWKRVVALGTTLVLVNGAAAYGIKERFEKNDKSAENTIGYDDFIYPMIDEITPIFSDIRENNFAILDVGDHDDVGVILQDRKMKYCNDNDISLGIITSTNSYTENDIYDDVEYVKGLINKYKIDFPVYLDIDKIILNDNLNTDMKTKLIKDFLDKCSSNGIYVGVYGQDSNLCMMRKYCNIKNYDAYVVMENDEIKYKGSYNIYKDLDGSIKSTKDISKVINKRNLNDKNNFSNDGSYTITSSEELLEIAFKYGMSVNDLLDFNDMKKSDIKTNTIIRLPMIINNDSNLQTDYSYKRLKKPIKGCDMSYSQGKSPNWNKLSKNFDFMILRGANGITKDDRFDEYATNCNLYNIPIGVYCYNYYSKINCNNVMSEFEKAQKKQANNILNIIKNKKIDYPIYLDLEGNQHCFDKKYVASMLKIWKSEIESSGYIAGIYCNQNWYKFLSNCVDYDLDDVFSIWLAGGDQYGNESKKSDNIEFKDITPSKILKSQKIDGYDKKVNIEISQSSNVSVNSGAYDGRGHLDIDFSMVDYTDKKLKNSSSEKEFKTKEFKKYDYRTTAIPIAGASIIGCTFGFIKSRKKKKRNKKLEKATKR